MYREHYVIAPGQYTDGPYDTYAEAERALKIASKVCTSGPYIQVVIRPDAARNPDSESEWWSYIDEEN